MKGDLVEKGFGPGRGSALLRPLPLRPVLATFTAHGSSRPLPSLLPGSLLLRAVFSSRGPFAQPKLASNLSLRFFQSFQQFAGSPPDPRQHAFRLATCPIRRVMDSPRLSAGGLRFLGLPLPLEDSAFLTSGLPAEPDSNGVSTFRTDEMRSGRMPFLLRGRLVSLRDREAVLLQCRSNRSASLAQHRRISHLPCSDDQG